MQQNNLISSFLDTMNLIASNDTLGQKTEHAIANTKVYKENYCATSALRKEQGEIIVEENTSFTAAKKYLQYGRTAVLNFANPHNPGGGVANGAMAQEECLCRSSNLYACLTSSDSIDKDYYEYHKEQNNYFFSDRLIYSRDISVFKTDDTIPQLMDEIEWFDVDIITCAAPYLVRCRDIQSVQLKGIFKSRIKNIFEVARNNHAEVLILGAWGCGAFGNPPEIVAKAFHEVIEENNYLLCFKKLVFAIKKSNNKQCPNIMAFEHEFYTNSYFD